MLRSFKYFAVFLGAVLSMFAMPGKACSQDTVDYAFVVIETQVTRKGVETSDRNPEERRFYISNIVEIPLSNTGNYRNANKAADAYFTKTIVEPMALKGILHHYYDNNVVINNNGSYVSETREAAEENRKNTLDGLKEQNANIFTFNWNYSGDASGLDSSRPALLVHGSEQPLYGADEKHAESSEKKGEPQPPKRLSKKATKQ
jgi:hypothetical protein